MKQEILVLCLFFPSSFLVGVVNMQHASRNIFTTVNSVCLSKISHTHNNNSYGTTILSKFIHAVIMHDKAPINLESTDKPSQ